MANDIIQISQQERIFTMACNIFLISLHNWIKNRLLKRKLVRVVRINHSLQSACKFIVHNSRQKHSIYPNKKKRNSTHKKDHALNQVIYLH